MVISSLTSSKCWDIGENHLNWTHLRPNSRLSQNQNEFIYLQWYIRLATDLKLSSILDYLAANKSGILDRRRDFCYWSISSHSNWKVMPFRHLTECSTLRGNALHTHTQYWSINWNRAAAACFERLLKVICYARVWRNNRLYDHPNVACSLGRCYHNSKCLLVQLVQNINAMWEVKCVSMPCEKWNVSNHDCSMSLTTLFNWTYMQHTVWQNGFIQTL